MLRVNNMPSLPGVAQRLPDIAKVIVTMAADHAVQSLWAGTPRDRGHLVAWLTQVKQEQTSSGYRAAVGPLEGLDVDKPAPSNTIQNFVDWYLGSHPGANLGGPHGIQSWRFLPDFAKEELYRQRTGGASTMGGPLPPPKYFGAIQEGGAARTGVAAKTGFLNPIKSEVRSKVAGLTAAVHRVLFKP